MKLVEVLESEKQEYNNFVAAQESGSFLQSWEWGEWQSALGRQVQRCKLKVESGDIAATVQLIKMPLLLGKYYLYAPYGPVVSDKWLGASDQLLEALRQRFSGAIFIRIEPILQQRGLNSYPLCTKSTNIQPAITMVLDLEKSEEQLLAGMHQKTRYNIRLAQKHGVVVEDEFSITPGQGLYSKEAVELILQTQKRQAYRGHSEKYYKDLINFLALHNKDNDLKLHIYKAVFEKQLLASGIFLDFGKTRMYLYGGSSGSHREVMAPYVMHWQAIIDAKKQGMKIYDFGGSEVSSGGEKGFTRFKQGFGGRVVSYAGAYDLVNSKPLYNFYLLFRKINKLINKISG